MFSNILEKLYPAFMFYKLVESFFNVPPRALRVKIYLFPNIQECVVV